MARLGHPLCERFSGADAVHQETHRDAIDAKDRLYNAQIEHAVKHMQHEAITTQHHQSIGIFGRYPIKLVGKSSCGFLRGFTVGGHKGQSPFLLHGKSRCSAPAARSFGQPALYRGQGTGLHRATAMGPLILAMTPI